MTEMTIPRRHTKVGFSPRQAMLWKEWRESWWLLVPMLTLPAILVCGIFLTGEATSLWMIMLWLIACFVPGLLGARLYAAEAARGTAFFQLERPVSRQAIWNVRLTLPMYAILIGIALPMGMVLTTGIWKLMVVTLLIPGLILLFFSASLLCSVLMDRPATALAAGGVVAFAAIMALITPFMVLDARGLKADFLDTSATTAGFTPVLLIGSGMIIIAVGLLLLGQRLYLRQGA